VKNNLEINFSVFIFIPPFVMNPKTKDPSES